jgi:hypothetical protein
MYEPYEVFEFWIAFSFCCLNICIGEEKYHMIVLNLAIKLSYNSSKRLDTPFI